MSWTNKVVWSEGLFIRPQHFQQQDRYTEKYVEDRVSDLRSYSWGFTELTLDADLLKIGKVGILSAHGVLPDGTPFRIPEDAAPPPAIDVDEDMRGSVVYLSLPVRQPGVTELALDGDKSEGLPRFELRELEASDVSAISSSSAPLQVAGIRARLLTEEEQRSEYACLGITQIVECRVDKQVVLEDSYIPPMLNAHADARIAGLIKEVQGLLHHRAEALAGRISQAGKGGASEVAEFLLLQVVNRYEPVFAHHGAGHLLHPEALYRLLLEVAGELSTFTATSKRPGEFATYRHDDLRATYEPVMRSIRDSLSMVIEQNAIPIPLKERSYGVRVGQIADKSLISSASFVLAVSADMPTEDLQRRLPAQIKVGSVENIRELVNVQLPGIKIQPLPVAPRQIPFHAGNVYFELDRASDIWDSLNQSGGVAMHIGGEFPGIKLEFWAIRS